ERQVQHNRRAVHEPRAGAALPLVADTLRTGEPERLAQGVEERAMRWNVHADAAGVDFERDVDGTRTDELGSLGHGAHRTEKACLECASEYASEGSVMAIKRVGVGGFGLMGSGIAQVCAQAGYETVIVEVGQPLLDKGFGR